MKPLFLLALMTGLLLSASSAPRGTFYQVISSHPHDVKELRPFIKTVHQNGRLWIVRLTKKAPLHVMEHLRAIDGTEKSYVFESSSFIQPKILINEFTSEIVQQISKENIRADVIELSSYETRYAGTADNKKAVSNAMLRLQSYGYDVKEICYSTDACSVIAEKKGSQLPSEVLLVMGHIDSVGKSFAGADDNASGTAVLLEMARVLKDFPNRKTVRFFITNGEELGLIGATHYARLLANENKIKDIKLAINMDMVGYNKNGIVELETDAAYEPIARSFAELASRFTNLKTKITIGAWGSDHVPFLRRGVPSILTIENWDTKTPCYHQECDKPETLNYDYASEIGKLNTAAIITRDGL